MRFRTRPSIGRSRKRGRRTVRSGEFDAQGRDSLIAFDDNCDGALDSCTTTEYSRDGKTALGLIDRAWDGAIDGCHWVALDDHGYPDYDEIDNKCDGRVDTSTDIATIYDETGCALRMEFEMDADERLSSVIWTICDPVGRPLISESHAPGKDGETKSIWRYHEMLGSRFLELTVEGEDGILGSCKTTVYDRAGNIRVEAYDQTCSGIYDGCTFYERRDDGRHVKSYSMPCEAVDSELWENS
ncbi:MAG: hypothetical protein M5R36_05620 [Deltaproteobacteria bacterium]|nr:hypothetical protein [Deltaproteobacteria bacterium]